MERRALTIRLERRWLILGLIILLVGGLVPAVALAAGGTFTDDDNSLFEADIEWLAETGVTQGCGDGQFCPEDPVTRGQMAAFLHRFAQQAGAAPLPPANPGSKMWVLPITYVNQFMHVNQVRVRVLNPGDATTVATCFFFDEDGAPTTPFSNVGGQTESFNLRPGASRECYMRADGGGNPWVLVSSNRPVLVVAGGENSGFSQAGSEGAFAASWVVQPYPIDCTDPSDYGFVCQFAFPEG